MSVRQNPLSSPLCFVHTLFGQAWLPRACPPAPRFIRSAGPAWLTLQSTSVVGLPYGSLARLLLVYLSTEVLRSRTTTVWVGTTPAELLRRLGLAPEGRRYRMLYRQLQALLTCHMEMGFHRVMFQGTLGQTPASLSNVSGTHMTCPGWTPLLPLSPQYCHTLSLHALPLHWETLVALRRSSLAMDIYIWLAHRFHHLATSEQWISWKHLHDQFGQEYTSRYGLTLFRREFLSALQRIQPLYPQARLQLLPDGLRLLCSPPPVAPLPSRSGNSPRATPKNHEQPGGDSHPGRQKKKTADLDS